MTTAKRFYEIDLLRFVAAFSVMTYHFSFRGWAWDDLSSVQFPELGQVTRYGFLGVNLFFIISGFVISMSASGRSAYEFLRSRIVRLYPAYWFCLMLTTAVIIGFGGSHYSVHLKQFLVNITMLQSFVGVEDVAGVYWTLGVELKFYLMIFVILSLRQFERLEVFLGAWLLASMALLWVGPVKILTGLLIPSFAGFFIAGALCYLIHQSGLTPVRAIMLALAIATALFASWHQSAGAAFTAAVDKNVVAAIELAMFVIFIFVALGKFSFISSPACVFWGSLTYPLYLVHEDVGYILLNHGAMLNRYVLLVAVMLAMLTTARLIHILIERRLSQPLKSGLDSIRQIFSLKSSSLSRS